MKLRTKIVLQSGVTAFLIMGGILLAAVICMSRTLTQLREEGRAYTGKDLQIRAENNFRRLQDSMTLQYAKCSNFQIPQYMMPDAVFQLLQKSFEAGQDVDAILTGNHRNGENISAVRGCIQTDETWKEDTSFDILLNSGELKEFLQKEPETPQLTELLVLPRNIWILRRNRDFFFGIRLNHAWANELMLSSDAGVLAVYKGKTVEDVCNIPGIKGHRSVIRKIMEAMAFSLQEDETPGPFITTEHVNSGKHQLLPNLFVTGFSIQPSPGKPCLYIVRAYDYDSLIPLFPHMLESQTKLLRLYIILFFSAGLFLLFLPAVLIPHQLTKRLARAVEFADRLAQGDFSSEADVKQSGVREVDQLMKSLGYMRDRLNSMISKLKRSHEREQEARKNAENLNRVKSDFLDTLSLEYHEPLSSLSSFVALQENKLTRQDSISPDDLRKILKACRMNIDNLAKKSNTLYELSKLDKPDNGILNPENCEFLPLLQSVSNTCLKGLADKLEVELHYSSDLPGMVHIDKQKFVQMVSLMTDSILRNTEDHAKISFSCTRNDTHILMDIRGDMRTNILPMEYILYSSAGRPLRSFELPCDIINLMIAKYYANCMDAEYGITCSEEENTFLLRAAFPLAEMQMPAVQEDDYFRNAVSEVHTDKKAALYRMFRTMQNTEEKPRILLAEDDEPQKILLEMMLSENNCQVTACDHVRGIREKLKQEVPDILILDLHMKELDRFPFLAEVRKNTEHNKPYIIVLASYLEGGDRSRLISAGANCCLQKPVNMDELADAVWSFMKTK